MLELDSQDALTMHDRQKIKERLRNLGILKWHVQNDTQTRIKEC
jgi:hypothetical protein